MQSFHELKVWQKAHQLALAVYRTTAAFPRSELYGLTSQMRRAAVSIASNIAEGCGRDGGADFARFLQMAAASASELEYHVLLARDLQFVRSEASGQLRSDVTEVKRMLSTLIRKVRGSSSKPPPNQQSEQG